MSRKIKKKYLLKKRREKVKEKNEKKKYLNH